MISIRVTVTDPKAPSRFTATPLRIIYIFAGMIVLGTILLLLPIANRHGEVTPFMVALFTATSAITVTGLVVENTATYWSRTGQVFILGMMYLGGLSFMTIATFLLILIGHRVSIAQRLLLREILLINQLGGLVRITVAIVLVATAIQAAGFVALFTRFYFIYPIAEAIWQAAFHSVSAFNNGGFNVLTEPGELVAFRSDKAVLSVMTLLIFVGAISYLVIIDVVRARKFSLFTLNTKMVLVIVGILTLIGAVQFLVVEYQNPDTIGPLAVEDKLMVAAFQSVSNRTAGFNTVDYGAVNGGTKFLTTALMFIGGTSASVAGGMKVNTLAVILAMIIATLRSKAHTSAFGREISGQVVQRAIAIGVASFLYLIVVTILLTITEQGVKFLDLLFEGASAFGTVGLSTGVTPGLSVWGRLIIVLTMFIGKLGPLTLGLTMAQQRESDAFRYPSEGVFLG